MPSGVGDSLYFRANLIPSHGVTGRFINPEDDYSHGPNERAPIASIDSALLLMCTLLLDPAEGRGKVQPSRTSRKLGTGPFQPSSGPSS